jgi:hypothetical protein
MHLIEPSLYAVPFLPKGGFAKLLEDVTYEVN